MEKRQEIGIPYKILSRASRKFSDWLWEQTYHNHLISMRPGEKEIIVGVDIIIPELPTYYQYNNYKIPIKQRIKSRQMLDWQRQ